MQNHNPKLKANVKARSYQFSLKIIRLVGDFPKNDNFFWVIGNQLLRSSTSVGANIVEARSSSSKRDFINYFTHALKSANETKYWLRLIKDSEKASQQIISEYLEEIYEISNILGKSLLTMKGKSK